ncbi:hypothetical protein A2865_00250 [Candidatus Woesebacteria bacterium RIFCSPHIGHO2_01_FULL_39_17]|uniref:Phosphodiester glycosidase domain-containing protein n=3 Tax=Candidatus Woeseibacteriota TaxID=1752722 RepID=A0A0G0RKU6_9BACT|nr:MAG: hypothetical protein US72_C0005G0008 [Microgenomates group bacterium GW2011_GWC1_38_12]KKQ94203.1 MAG: hypothetical protein UT19_C0003G0008 [Candidatus Woesebacteria bacterium GW2011_GWB1_39_10b]KKR14267.1 MAG: hypothetical protein UT40_C0003G0009 [Candidatus Woesebacteria bacterium GW2011_GWA1_39_21b]OGM23663.1 MAG: hypothetical protein A2865_00250 [Candidatus Woesebacteria bacterium RIFCSPHIGHO2_01_FULL_39_17]OGM65485.1 MAG: hypothetical protein A3A52_00990 [Candidatus Woesebacteria b
MKRILFILLPILAFLVVLIFFYKSKGIDKKIKTPQKEEQAEESFSPTPSLTESFNSSYQTVWVTVRDIGKIKLFLNLVEKLSSDEASTKNNCAHLINGGFYDKNDKPIGLFVIDGRVLEIAKENSLLNGYFYIDLQEKAYIESVSPKSPSIAVQAGPILFKNQKPVSLTLSKDELARRIVVATTKDQKAIFLVFYTKANPLLGPTLSELPGIIEEIRQNAKLDIVNAINLDGGTHSSFLTKNFKLSEVATIGSYFCIVP